MIFTQPKIKYAFDSRRSPSFPAESREERKKGKVHSLRIHKMLFAVELRDDFHATKHKIHARLGLTQKAEKIN